MLGQVFPPTLLNKKVSTLVQQNTFYLPKNIKYQTIHIKFTHIRCLVTLPSGTTIIINWHKYSFSYWSKTEPSLMPLNYWSPFPVLIPGSNLATVFINLPFLNISPKYNTWFLVHDFFHSACFWASMMERHSWWNTNWRSVPFGCWKVIHCVDIPCCAHLFNGWRTFRLFPFGAIRNKASINIPMQVFVETQVLISLG